MSIVYREMSHLLNLKLGGGGSRSSGDGRVRDGGRLGEREQMVDRDRKKNSPKTNASARYCSPSPECKRSWLSESYQNIKEIYI